jgi:serine/threonine-protein kinase
MPFFSPDGQWLGFYDGQLLKKVSIASRIPVAIGRILNPRGAAWGDDGTIVFNNLPNRGLLRTSANGGAAEVLTVPDPERREKTHRFPEMLPGGRAVLFTLGTGDIDTFDDASIAVLSLDTGAYRKVLEGGAYARYSPTGHLVYARAGALLAAPFNLAELEVTGAPVAVLEGVASLPIWASAAFALSHEGSLLYAPGGARQEERKVVWVDRLGRSEPLIERPRPFQGSTFRLSPDGKWLALTIQGANNSLWLYEIARGALTRLVTGGFDNTGPIWTPDGAQVTFWSSREGTASIFKQSVNAGSPLERIGEGIPNSWSPDGAFFAYHRSHPSTGDDLWILSVDTDKSRAFLATPGNESGAAFSPDGRFIAYQSDESGENEVYVLPFPGPGAKRQVSTGGGTLPLWSRSGKELFYRHGPRMMAVDVDTREGLVLGKPRLLFERPGADEGYDVAPDGQRFVMLDRVESEPPPRELILVQNWSEELKRLVPTN